ncbi:uncharacterized protein LY89DRAFT_79101 [Mollisia scopiformis]|uniref:Uncharacterized protein n=1 Tax=Mollisia scopiformis TaxID=149040 RepID=A0A194X805_MOLSC|nr:uncharacterized protein LY89DRAFT_79101 [Mollisia scopiformis]KUJ16293.1 hypothetical protein LY89DRAFT_79101 [Mollisia scopiformis]
MRGVELPKNPKFTSITSEVLSVPYNLQDASRYFDSDEIDPAMSDIIRTRLLAAAGLNDDAVSAEHQATAKRLNIKPISPNRDVNLFFTHNPTYCGSVALQLAADSEESGLRLANYHVVPTLIAHLYSETQRTRLLDAAWPEIDQFIGMHIADIFNGQRPQSAAEAFIKYTKTLGISTTTRLNRHQRENPFKEPNYSLLPVSDALRPYFEGKDTFAASVSKLEAVVQAHRQMITHTSKHKRRETRRKLTPIQFLGKMQHLLRRDTEASYRLHKSDQDLLPVDEANTFRDQDKCWNRLPSLQWRRYS